MKAVYKNPIIFVQRVYIVITYRIVRLFDAYHDRRICGIPLTRMYSTGVKGGNTYSGTCYWTLEKIFAGSKFTESDSIVDVGCGQGRLFAFLIKYNFPGRMTGIEYHEPTAAIAKAWTSRYPEKQIRIIQGDAFDLQYDEFTVIYYFNSFKTEYFVKFIHLLEEQLTHPIRFYFMTDHGHWQYLKGRPGWKGYFRKKTFMKYGLCMWGSPQYYSLWKYTPSYKSPAPSY